MTDVKEQLAQTLFDHIPVGVGSQGIIATSAKDLEAALEMGMDWSLREVCSFTSADQGVHGALKIASASGKCLQSMCKHGTTLNLQTWLTVCSSNSAFLH